MCVCVYLCEQRRKRRMRTAVNVGGAERCSLALLEETFEFDRRLTPSLLPSHLSFTSFPPSFILDREEAPRARSHTHSPACPEGDLSRNVEERLLTPPRKPTKHPPNPPRQKRSFKQSYSRRRRAAQTFISSQTLTSGYKRGF